MPTYLHPGVYIEEIPSGSRPIEGVSTSTAAFVGYARRGPTGEATLIQKLDDYNTEYGEIATEDDTMGFAVQAFYLNGGKAAYICRLLGDGSTAADIAFTSVDSAAADILTVSAKSEGEWGNDLYVRVLKPDIGALTFTLEVGRRVNDKFTADETYSGLSMREDDDNYALTAVNDESSLIELSLEAAAAGLYQGATVRGGEVDDDNAALFSAAAAAATGFWTLTLNINGLGTQQISIDPGALGLAGAFHNTDAATLATAITAAVNALGTAAPYQNFTCTYVAFTDRFELIVPASVPVSDSNAKLEVTAGTLAAVLRLESTDAARLTGKILDPNDLFSDGFADLATEADRTLNLNIDNHGVIPVVLAAGDVTLAGTDNEADGVALARAVQAAVRALNPGIAAYRNFSCAYESRQFILTSGSGSPRQSGLSVNDSGLAGLMGLNPADPTVLLLGREFNQGSARVIPVQNLGALDSGVQLTEATEFAPAAANFADFYDATLRKVRDVSIIVLPGQTWAEDGSGNPVISQTVAFAETYKRMVVIVDPPEDLELDQAVTVNTMGLPTSTYSVLYYPWVQMANPLYNVDRNPTAARYVSVAPSGFAAGMWAKIDGKRGVWKAPAGVETQLLGASGLEFTVEDGEQDQLNPLGVNCIRKLPGYGSVIWGGRTLATKADPEWRYVPVRRTAIFIEQSIYQAIQWAVFEPNDKPLWSSLRSNIGAFMNGLFRNGAFQGGTSNEAYFVRCGLGDTMTQGDIDRGQVIVIVGFAPLKPAEFVIVRIQQKVGEQ